MKFSLKIKTSLMVALVALALTCTSVIISYRVYSGTMDGHYKTLAMNIAQTAASMVDADQVKNYTSQVMKIYEQNVAPKFQTEEEWDKYFQQYRVIEDEDYTRLKQTLEKVREANHADSLYIVYMDPKSMTCVYVADPDKTENACPAGTWDIIYEQNYDAMLHPEDGFPAYITNSEYGWLCSAGAAIMDSDGTVIAHAMVDISMEDIMKDRQNFLMTLCAILVVVTIVLMIILAYITNRFIVKPINILMLAAGSYVSDRNSRDHEMFTAIERLDIHTGDEIESLSVTIKKMEREINTYIDNLASITAEKERIGAELNIATQIQASMLPRIFPPFPERKDVNIYATMNPAKEVGGDFYDFFLVDDCHLGMVIADVSGKGVPAALFMVIAKTLIKDHACAGAEPSEVFTWVNQQLCESNEAGLFVTAWMGILNVETGHVEYVNAGHNPPLLAAGGGDFAYLKQKSGFVLAGMEGFLYQQASFDLYPGDRLFLYTDGVTEAMNNQEEFYGEDRLSRWLNKNRNLGLTDTLHGLRQDIYDFCDGAEQHDDITMLIYEMVNEND